MLSGVELRKAHFQKFLSVSCATGASRAINASLWCHYSFDELVESSTFLLKNIPTARSGVLEFIGILIHENVTFFLRRLENPNLMFNVGFVEEAISELCSVLEDLASRQPPFINSLSKWVVDNIAEISRSGQSRPAISNASSTERTRIYTSSSITKRLIDLLGFCISHTLENDVERCAAMLLDLWKNCASFCDWILIYLSTRFSDGILRHLLKVGLSDFCTYVNDVLENLRVGNSPMVNQLHDQYSKEKLRSLSSMLALAARQQTSDFSQLVSSIFSECCQQSHSKRHTYYVPFLVRLLASNADLANIVVKEIVHSVTLENLGALRKSLLSVPGWAATGEPSFTSGFVNIVASLSSETASLVYERLLNFAFEVQVNGSEESLVYMQKQCLTLTENNLDAICISVHEQPIVLLSKFPLLVLIESSRKLVLKALFSSNEQRRTCMFKAVFLICLIKGHLTTAEYLGYVLCFAESRDQLRLFTVLCAATVGFHADAVQYLVADLPFYMHKASEVDTVSWKRCAENILILLKEGSIIDSSKTVDYVRMSENLLKNYRTVLKYLLPLYFVAGIENTVSEILLTLDLPGQQDPGDFYGTVKLFLASIFNVMRKFEEAVQPELLRACYAMGNRVLALVSRQDAYAKSVLFHNLFAMAFEDDSPLRVAPRTKLLEKVDCSILKQNLLMSEGRYRYGSVHCGTLRRRQVPCHTLDTGTNVHVARRLWFVHMIDELSRPEDSPTGAMYDLKTCHRLGIALVDSICPDLVDARHYWEEWDEAQANIEKYITIRKVYDSFPFIYDLLLIVAEIFPCLWFCLPIVKAVLATTMVNLESAANRADPVNSKVSVALERWFLMVAKGGILPKEFDIASDVCNQVTNKEACHIMRDVWGYLNAYTPKQEDLEEYYENLLNNVDDLPSLSGDPTAYLVTLRLVIQRNIRKLGRPLRGYFDIPSVRSERSE
uniref:Uncharacterized protein n=1 Tax=Trichuris muris TaxID=70415 RepID=A0A5S6QXS7_TRIMR